MALDLSPREGKNATEAKANKMISSSTSASFRGAFIIRTLIAEGRLLDASKYLYALRRVSVNEWLAVVDVLLKKAQTSREISVYSDLFEVSKGSLLSHKAHIIPGLSESLHGRSFDYEKCLEFVQKTRQESDFWR